MKILIDHVHAFGTDIRTAPGGTLDEVTLTRRIANSVVHDLRRAALDTSLLVPESRSVSLSSRITRLRHYACRYGASNILLAVIAVGSRVMPGTWSDTSGWSVLYRQGSAASRRLADSLTLAAISGLGRQAISPAPSAMDLHLLGTLPLLDAVTGPAVITSNLSLSTAQDIKKLSTPKGRQQIINLHVNGVFDFLSAI